MGLFDKLKEGATAAAEKAKNIAETTKANYEQKKAEEEAHRQEMETEATRRSEEIKNAIENAGTDKGFFDGIGKEELLKFTKDFFDKILLPASSVAYSKILMYPNIDGDKKFSKFVTSVSEFNSTETALIYLRAEGKQEFVLTDKALYYSIVLEQDKKYFSKGRISCDKIERFQVEKTDTTYNLMCDSYMLASFSIDKAATEDFIGLGNYFECIANRDFEITDEEVDRLIKEKISSKVYDEVKKYLVYDDEILVYFAWGIDSLSAKDYIFCTNKQIVMINREMLGATANIKQFYYEDITSASVEQNAKSNDLTVALIETAITAATKTCDLVLSVAGSAIRINTLYKAEAERIVAVYHHYRKAAKTASAQPTVVVQQQIDPMEQLKKLAEMKDMGIITQEEFDTKKKQLLGL